VLGPRHVGRSPFLLCGTATATAVTATSCGASEQLLVLGTLVRMTHRPLSCVWRRGAGAVQGRTTSRSPLRSAWSTPDPSVGFRSGHVRVALLSASPGSRRRLTFEHAPPPSPR
jgi:hypothetical protein